MAYITLIKSKTKKLKTSQKQLRLTINANLQKELDFFKNQYTYLNEVEIIKILIGEGIKAHSNKLELSNQRPKVNPFSINNGKIVFISQNHNDIYDQ